MTEAIYDKKSLVALKMFYLEVQKQMIAVGVYSVRKHLRMCV